MSEGKVSEVSQDTNVRYGWTLEYLRAPSISAYLLDMTTPKSGSQLRTLDLDVTDLEVHGLECVGRFIRRSKRLDTPVMWV